MISIITFLGALVVGMSIFISLDQFRDALAEDMALATSQARLQGREELLVAIYDAASLRGQVTIAKPVIDEEGETVNSPSILLRVVQQQPIAADPTAGPGPTAVEPAP